MLKLLTDTSWDYSALDLPQEEETSLRELAMPNNPRRRPSERSWWKQWSKKPKEVPSETSQRNGKSIQLNDFSITDALTKKIGKECGPIFPLQNVLVRKMKMLKKPKFDYTKLMELYTEKDDKKRKGHKGGEAKAAEGEEEAADEDAENLLKKWS